MKKRIISLILVVVTLALSLVGCAYSYASDDLNKYAKFDAKAFAEALLAIDVEDGDFTADNETRIKKVEDAMYSAIAGTLASDVERKTTGVVGEHDKFYYCYYITYTDKAGNTVQLAPDYMATSKALNLLLGQNEYSTDLQEKISEAAKDFVFSAKDGETEIKNNYVRTEALEKPAYGNLAAISYKLTYDPDGKGNKTVTVASEIVTLDESNPIHKQLVSSDKAVATTLDKFTIPENSAFNVKGEAVNVKIEVSDAKVNYLVAGKEMLVTDKTYEKAPSKAPKTIFGEDAKDLEGTDLTYHVYAYQYVQVDELNIANVIKLVYGKNFTKNIAKSLIFGADFAEKEEADQKKEIEKYNVIGITAAEKSTVFDTFIDKLVTALTDYATKKTALSSAEQAYNDALEAEEKAKIAAGKDNATEAEKQEYEDAKADTAAKKKTFDNATKDFNTATDTRDELVAAFITQDYKTILDAKDAYTKAVATEAEKKEAADKAAEADKEAADKAYNDAKAATAAALEAYNAAKNPEDADDLLKGYEDLTYYNLQEAYRTEMKEKIVLAIMDIIEKNVTVTGYPEQPCEEAYDMLINNYKYSFYKENVSGTTTGSSTSESNYTKYGTFQKYLIAAVSKDITTVDTYEEAIAELEKKAQQSVKTVLQFTYVAAHFDADEELLYTDEEFKQYKKDNKASYESAEFYYGESAVRNGLQFEKLMDYFLKSTEENGKDTVGDERYVIDKYTNIKLVEKTVTD